jgi:hypothetical protein
MTDTLTHLDAAQALTLAPMTYRRELAETLDALDARDQVALVTQWIVRTGAIWNPPAALGNAWGPLEGELTLFGMTAFGHTLEEAIASWIKHVRRSDQATEDAA